MREFIKKRSVLHISLFFFLRPGTKQQVSLLRGKVPEVSSHKFEERERLEQICCGWMIRFTFYLNKFNCSCVLYFYCPVEPNVDS